MRPGEVPVHAGGGGGGEALPCASCVRAMGKIVGQKVNNRNRMTNMPSVTIN